MRAIGYVGGVLGLVVAVGCAAPQGPHVRVASATAAEMRAHQSDKVVWYEFQKGDEVPVKFGMIGMAQVNATNPPLRLVAARPFYVVRFKDGRTKFSYDGKRLVNQPYARWAMLVGAGEEGGETALLLYIGPKDEVPAELR